MSDILETRFPKEKIFQKEGPIEMAQPEGNYSSQFFKLFKNGKIK